MTSRIIFPIFLLSLSLAATGQNSIAIGEKLSLHSKILNESRDIQVYKPNKTNAPLPLILVFDGESLFEPTVSAAKFLTYAQEIPSIPEVIIVGILNKDRNRDMPVPQVYGGKGEENFSHFITEELLPFLTKQYSLNQQIILIGHSQGGLFVSYLMAQFPNVFSMTISLDAPLNVDTKTEFIKQKITSLLQTTDCKSKYASMDMAYGWGKDWQVISQSVNATRKEYPEETHESMPYKSIYDGLKFLYKNFSPPKRDMAIIPLLLHYEDVSNKFGYPYKVPEQVLLASTHRKIINGRKQEALELLDYAEQNYGSSNQATALRDKANKLPDNLDPQVEFYLNHVKPTAAEIKKYVGHWMGELMVRDGSNLPIDMEIVVENGKGKMISVLPWPPYEKVESEILLVNKQGQLVWGRKNRGSGLVISTSEINRAGKLEGKEQLIGFIMPDEMPEEIKERMKDVIKNPNTFLLGKK